jgi:hypothetical protein
MLALSKAIRMPLDMLISVGHNHGVCVAQMIAVKHVPCLYVIKREGTPPGGILNGFFVPPVRTPSVIKSLHGLRGRKHRLTPSPVASRLDSQRGTRQHAFDKGGNSKGMEGIAGSKLRWQGIKKYALWAREGGFLPWVDYA